MLVFVLLLSILFLGCNTGHSNNNNSNQEEENSSIDDGETFSEKSFQVEENQGEEEYKVIQEVVKSDEIESTITIIENAKWEENTEVSMPLPPEYRFTLESVKYGVWVSPHGDKLELVAEGQAKYVKLSRKESEALYEIMTGKEL